MEPVGNAVPVVAQNPVLQAGIIQIRRDGMRGAFAVLGANRNGSLAAGHVEQAAANHRIEHPQLVALVSPQYGLVHPLRQFRAVGEIWIGKLGQEWIVEHTAILPLIIARQAQRNVFPGGENIAREERLGHRPVVRCPSVVEQSGDYLNRAGRPE